MKRAKDGTSIDRLARRLLQHGIVEARYVLDGSLSVVDVSRRNANHAVRWGNGNGFLLKECRPGNPSAGKALRREAGFYATCARIARAHVQLPLARMRPRVARALSAGPALAIDLVRDAVTLLDYRAANADWSEAYRSLGNGIGLMHAFTASRPFARTTWARSLPNSPPWALSIHQPNPDSLRYLSRAQVELLGIVQRARHVGPGLDALRSMLSPSTVVHGDLKADNVLVTHRAGHRPTVAIVDWESAIQGDPAWDIGGVLQDLLASWFQLAGPQRGIEMRRLVDGHADELRAMQTSIRTFWRAYLESSGTPADVRDALLRKSIMCSAAHLVERASEHGQYLDELPNYAITMLQAADNMFAAPASAALLIYGLPLARPRTLR